MRINGEKVTMVELKDDFDIKGLRQMKLLSQVEVAKACGVSLQAYQRWENHLTKSIPEVRFNILKEMLD